MNECQYRTIDVRGPGWGQGPGGTNDVGSSLKVDVSEEGERARKREEEEERALGPRGEDDR